MASPRKASVDMGAPAKVGSRIRRDPPPPPPRKVTPSELREKEAKLMVAGIAAFAIAIALLLVSFGRGEGYNPQNYTVVIED